MGGRLGKNKSDDGGGAKKEKKAKKGKGKKVEDALAKLKRKSFEITKLPNTDDFFSKIQAPMDTLSDLSDAVADANEGILTLVDVDEDIKKANIERTVPGVLKYMVEQAKISENQFYLKVDDDGTPSLETKKRS